MNDTIQHYVKPEPFEMELPVALTDTELLQRGKRAANISKDIAGKESALDTLKQSYKAQIKELESERERIEFEQREGVAQRLVRCERRFVYRTGEVQEVRLDTGEIMSVRAMNERERQPKLPGMETAKPKEAAEDFTTPPDADSHGTGGDSPDTEEHPDTSVLDSASPIVPDDYDPNAPIGTEQSAPGDFNSDEPQASNPPDLPTQKRQKAKGGKGSRGGKAKS